MEEVKCPACGIESKPIDAGAGEVVCSACFYKFEPNSNTTTCKNCQHHYTSVVDAGDLNLCPECNHDNTEDTRKDRVPAWVVFTTRAADWLNPSYWCAIPVEVYDETEAEIWFAERIDERAKWVGFTTTTDLTEALAQIYHDKTNELRIEQGRAVLPYEGILRQTAIAAIKTAKGWK